MAATIAWRNQEGLPLTRQFDCGYCGFHVAAHLGFMRSDNIMCIGLCPQCSKPTVLETPGGLSYPQVGRQIPGAVFGEKVDHLPSDINGLYNEARNCHGVAAYTAGAMACRKILMNVAVNKGATAGSTFGQCVGHLDTNGFFPVNARAWIDHIRVKGNEAAHEIPATIREDLEDLLTFLAMFLRITYEFPARVPSSPQALGSS